MSLSLKDVRVGIPGSWPEPFRDGIRHPELWLWDSWVWQGEGRLHLYCLALAKRQRDGTPITPGERNAHAFHVRKFVSTDGGRTFRDAGVDHAPGTEGMADSRNVWSGHVFGEDAGLFAYTGVSEPAPDRPFLQSICLGVRSGAGWNANLLSCPERDYDAIRAAGYYLGPLDQLGHVTGEEGGPILAWRDPFALKHAGGIRLFWSAKVGPKTPAIASADLLLHDGEYKLGPFRRPLQLPDAELMTQAEVPKVYAVEDGYILLVAACDRLYEGQPDAEVSKLTRAYRADELDGEWTAVSNTSGIEGLDHLFGVSALSASSEGLRILGPYTEMAPKALQLSFAAPREVLF